MSNSFGPWVTPINAGMNPQLSSFWKRRLRMLVSASQTSPILSHRNLIWLGVATILMIVLPTLRFASAVNDASPKGTEQIDKLGKVLNPKDLTDASYTWGVILDKNKQPISDADVRIYEVNFERQTDTLLQKTMSDGEGKFRLKLPTEKKPCHLTVCKQGFASRVIGPYAPLPSEFSELILSEPETLRGRVTGPEGQPVAGAVVWTPSFKEPVAGIESAKTDADGYYEIPDLTAWKDDGMPMIEGTPTPEQLAEAKARAIPGTNKRTLRIWHPDYGKQLVGYSQIPDVVNVSFKKPSIITGHVIDQATGKPIGGLIVSLEWLKSGRWGGRTVTDESGKFRLLLQGEGEGKIYFKREKWKSPEKTVETVSGSTLDLSEIKVTLSTKQKPSEPPANSPQEKKPEKNSPAAEAAQLAYKATVESYDTGRSDIEAVYRWSCRWMQAERADRGVLAIQSHLDRMQSFADKIKSLHDAGAPGGEAANLAAVRYYVVEAKEMVEEAKKSPPDSSGKPAAEMSPSEPAARPSNLQAIDEFKRLYALQEGECLKRVPPPFSPTRLDYYRFDSPGQAEGIPSGPEAMCLRWRNGSLKIWSMHFGGLRVNSLPEDLAEIFPQEIEGDGELLKTEISGDWIIREGAPKKEIIARLEKILNSECNLPVRLSLRDVERKVFVAHGIFRSQPGLQNRIQIYGKTLNKDGSSGGGSGDFDLFLKHVGRFIRHSVISEVEKTPEDGLGWSFNERYNVTKQEEAEDHDPATVLNHLIPQTSLSFKEESRLVPVLFVERAK